ncbi:serine/threonine protein kinase [Blastomyces gilchristii SLH14081]|uniref:Serine/threonine protein kinase n=1 Tax=Blastomyces gilchristii (strain SLH14081) TaxID=559298 RepID=A0A179V2V4_BLAGS|nr:serine/threonine protein kinase [Blastomyces gilchristii SLH14081]OAT13737.1 serine/threonine protein kinase [Blastomyces gilchristii SLH14081]
MPPQITAWEDLTFFHEEVDETGEFRHTTFAVLDEDDTAYFGKLNLPKHNITFLQLTSALAPISGNDLFPEWAPCNMELTQAQEPLPPNTYIKRPNISLYDIFQEYNVLSLIPKGLLEEAQAMEKISEHPHPNIVYYHGCRVRRGRITGLVLDRHPNTLTDYLKNKVGSIDKESFMQALKSAIYHLHSLGWAHNDLHPGNILVDEDGMPILIDFGSAREIGAKLGTSRGTKGWINKDMKDYHTSDNHHDLFALEKICSWLEAPIFDN